MSSIAEKLAKNQKEISVSEFFEKNRQILGFDSMSKSLIMGVKEAVDNSLDACEEASIPPEIFVQIEKIDDKEYKVTVEDNGPGIVKKQLPNVFGRLLYGSRFHAHRQSRGQQGIGISATVMYGQITTGKPSHVQSKVQREETAWGMDIIVNTKKNRPETKNEEPFIWEGKESGTRIEFYIKGRYITGRQSIFEYLKNTAIVNPHARVTFMDPDGKKVVFERATETLPPVPKEIKPHPQGIELGTLMNMAKSSREKRLTTFLKNDFNRISDRVAREIIDKASEGLDRSLSPTKNPVSLDITEAKALHEAIEKVKIMAPPTDCLSPIGEELIKKGLKHVLDEARPEYYAPPVTRSPRVAQGNPFLVEAGIVYGGELPKDSQVTILRFANRVPLLYQQGACAVTKAIENIDWRRYGLEQRGGKGIPYGPAIIMVHVASTKVPFTSEAKEAIANLEEIQGEVDLALRGCARKLKGHLNKAEKKKRTRTKFEIVQSILPQIAERSAAIVGKEVPDISRTITKIMNVVWVDSKAENGGKRRRVSIRVYNYTGKQQSFKMHTRIPRDAIDESIISPQLLDAAEGKVTWEFKRIPSSGTVDIDFDLVGEMADVFDPEELYVSGINPTIVMGADPLPGDWDIKGMEVIEEDEPVEEEEDEEPDYDEDGEVLEDDE